MSGAAENEVQNVKKRRMSEPTGTEVENFKKRRMSEPTGREVQNFKKRRMSEPTGREVEPVKKSETSAPAQVRNEKIFEYFTNLPSEVRMMVIDEMLPGDRCRFERCSKRCRTEAKASKNYVHELGFRVGSNSHIIIFVVHGNDKVTPNTGFILEFKEEDGINHMIYRIRDETELWRVDFDHSTIAEHALRYFTKLLELHQNIVRVLFVQLRTTEFELNHDFGITKTNQLEELWIEGKFDYLQFITKLRNPLKLLAVWENKLYQYPLEQVFEVRNHICYHDLKLNNQQYLRFIASTIHTHIGELTVKDVTRFLKSWIKGTLGRKMREIYWWLEGSDFNVERLFLAFGKDISNRDSDNEVVLEVKHEKDAGKRLEMKSDFSSIKVIFYGDE